MLCRMHPKYYLMHTFLILVRRMKINPSCKAAKLCSSSIKQIASLKYIKGKMLLNRLRKKIEPTINITNSKIIVIEIS